MKNLFEEECTEVEYLKKSKRKIYIPMQVMHGLKIGFKCKNCKHFLRKYGWFKCAKWYISSSEATDIKANQTACNLYEEANHD